jgi:hypothetical protein
VANNRKEIRYLRTKAKHFRELAAAERGDIVQKLLDIAGDLEKRAKELDSEQ